MDWTYQAIMLAAIVTGWVLFRRQPQPTDVRPWEVAAMALGAFCGGMIGAKLPFVLADWEGFLSGAAWFTDGKTIMAGLVGGYFGAEVTEWALDIRTKMCDSFAMPLAVGVGIGRLGCFHAGCCHGVPTSLPWGVDFGDGLARHPTQLYESAFHLTAAVVLWQLQRRGTAPRAVDPRVLGGLLRVSLWDRVHSPRGDDLAGPDRLSTGRAGADSVLRAVVLSRATGRTGCDTRGPEPPLLPRDTGDGVLKTTRTLCPTCLRPLLGTTVQRSGRVYLQRECPEHGVIEALVSSARRHYYLRDEVPHAPPAGAAELSSTSARGANRALPILSSREDGGDCQPDTSCGCGPGPGHRTCVALLEITNACNLHCPVCFAQSPHGSHRPVAELVCGCGGVSGRARAAGRAATQRGRAAPAPRPAAAHRPLPAAADRAGDDQYQRSGIPPRR